MGIVKKSIQTTTGDSDNIAQSFSQNIFFSSSEGVITPFMFDIPQYTTVGGTEDYYGQNPLAIFTSLVSPFIRFDFSANTSSFGSDVYIRHDFYRVNWDTFSVVQSGLKEEENNSIQSEKTLEETIEETDEDGVVKIRKIKTTTNEVNNTIKSKRKLSIESTEIGEKKFITPTFSDIQSQLDTPQFSVTASTTAITNSVYDLKLDQFTKNTEEYKSELFNNKDQYFVDTKFIFNKITNPELIESDEFPNKTTTETATEKKDIYKGDFEGLTIPGGKYFSYFQVPDKPVFEYPTPTGKIDTFTPEIFWSNAEKADSYMVQVNYNTGDTGFTGTIFTYLIPKTDEFKKESKNTSKESETEFTASKEIRTFQMSLKSNENLIYRVGNIYELKNLFGVKQSVVTFSDYNEITTQTEPIKTYVFTENDSPYELEIARLQSPPSLENESPERFSFSGTVSGSTVSGATMQLIYPDTSYITTPTNTIGEFEFDELEVGTYTLNTSYRGYTTDSRLINITSATTVFINIQINWDNIYDIWAIKENDIIKF